MAKRPINISLIIFDSFTGKELVALHTKYNPIECLKGKYRKWVMLQKKGDVRNLWKRYGMLQGEPKLKVNYPPTKERAE